MRGNLCASFTLRSSRLFALCTGATGRRAMRRTGRDGLEHARATRRNGALFAWGGLDGAGGIGIGMGTGDGGGEDGGWAAFTAARVVAVARRIGSMG